MAKAANDKTKAKNRPALSVEAREAHLISLAEDLAEQQLRDGTASSQLITHYLKLGSTRERLEKKLLAEQVELASAKKDNIRAQARQDELYEAAMKAMQRYNGDMDEEEYDEDIY
nr:MAG TPA: hypothetical protein [Caudoviricetes sp.]